MEIYTERLFIRPIQMKDKNSFFDYRSDPATYKFLSFIPQSLKDVEEFIQKCSISFNVPDTWFQLVLLSKNEHTLIGDIGIHFLNSNDDNKQVEIGYTLNPLYRNKGYAKEALFGIIDYLFNHLDKHRITASIDPSNTSSIQLIKKLGFRKEAHFKKSLLFHGEWVDDLVFALLAEEWKQQK